MTELLEKAIQQVNALPDADQDWIAQAIFALTNDDAALEEIPLAHRAAVEEGLAQLDRGEFASEAEVKAVFERWRK